MRFAISTDERAPVVEAVIAALTAQGHSVVDFGPAPGEERDWPLVTRAAAEAVAAGQADEAVVFCYTGTGASIAANKVPGVRAALCGDAETARGARKWNHANVLVLSIRATTVAIAQEILAAWLAEPWSTDAWNCTQIARIAAQDAGRPPA